MEYAPLLALALVAGFLVVLARACYEYAVARRRVFRARRRAGRRSGYLR